MRMKWLLCKGGANGGGRTGGMGPLSPGTQREVVKWVSPNDACNTRILGVQNPGANINTRCAGTKSHTYDV
jgi:hypothetical protein